MTSLSDKTINNALTRSNKGEITSWGVPDYTAGIVPTFPFTCPSDGVLYIRIRDGVGVFKTNLTGTNAFSHYCPNINYATSQVYTFAKGQIITLETDTSGGVVPIFYPLKGVVNA